MQYLLVFFASQRADVTQFASSVWRNSPLRNATQAKVHLIHLGPKLDEASNGLYEWNAMLQRWHHLVRLGPQKSWPQALASLLERAPKRPEVLLYGGHSGGMMIGIWERSGAHMDIAALARILHEQHVHPRVLVFDSCYGGQLVNLYQMRRVAPIILASPSWSRDSVLRTRAFARFSAAGNWPRAVCREYNALSRIKYHRLCVYHMRHAEPLVSRLSVLARPNSGFEFDWRAQNRMHSSDPNAYSLRRVVAADSRATQLLSRMMQSRDTRDTPSIEHRIYCKYRNVYSRLDLMRGLRHMFMPARGTTLCYNDDWRVFRV
jgi:hypothetical protein